MYKTLNNEVAKHILMCALNGEARYCAYSLYNHWHGNSFNKQTYDRLYMLTIEFLGDKANMLFDDKSVDFCVRDFINRYYGQVE